MSLEQMFSIAAALKISLAYIFLQNGLILEY